MCTATAYKFETLLLNLPTQMRRIENPYVPTRRRAVLLAELPTNPLWPLPWNADTQAPAGLQHAQGLLQYREIVRDVLQNFTGDDHIDRFISKWQGSGVSRRKTNLTAGRVGLHVCDTTSCSGQILRREIQAQCEHTLQKVRRQGVTALSTTHIQAHLPGRQL